MAFTDNKNTTHEYPYNLHKRRYTYDTTPNPEYPSAPAFPLRILNITPGVWKCSIFGSGWIEAQVRELGDTPGQDSSVSQFRKKMEFFDISVEIHDNVIGKTETRNYSVVSHYTNSRYPILQEKIGDIYFTVLEQAELKIKHTTYEINTVTVNGQIIISPKKVIYGFSTEIVRVGDIEPFYENLLKTAGSPS